MSEKKGWRLREYIRAVVKHGTGLWTGVVVTIGAWFLDKFITAEWWVKPSPLFYVLAAAIGLTITQYRVWLASVTETEQKLDTVKRKLRASNKRFRQVAQQTGLELLVGRTANFSPTLRFENAVKYLEELEAEIYAGDFSRAGDVLKFKDLFHDELRIQFAGGIGFSEWYGRYMKLVQAVERFAQDADDEV